MNKSELIADLRRDEGWRDHVYQDHLGYWTIGYGFLVDARRGGRLPRAIGEKWLDHLVDRKCAELDQYVPWWRHQPAGVQQALANMAYQLGVGGLLNFSRTLAALQGGNYDEAAREMLNSRWAHQTPVRAARAVALIQGGAP